MWVAGGVGGVPRGQRAGWYGEAEQRDVRWQPKAAALASLAVPWQSSSEGWLRSSLLCVLW